MPNRSKMRNAVIPIAWAEMTARGQEKMWLLLKRIGILKNVNFMTGHAALALVTEKEFLYFDFGRYLTENGFGRARGANTDPKLTISTRPQWSEKGELLNVVEFLAELESMSDSTHGIGPISVSILYPIDCSKVISYIEKTQHKGQLLYGAMSPRKLNCARFVTRAILAGSPPKKISKALRFSWIGATTPLYNVAVCAENKIHIRYFQGIIAWKHMTSFSALLDLAIKCSYSFRTSRAKFLPSDERMGYLSQENPSMARLKELIYLGGIGEGAYHEVQIKQNILFVKRYTTNGSLEYEQVYSLPAQLENNDVNCFTLLHDSHYQWITVKHSDGWTERLFAK